MKKIALFLWIFLTMWCNPIRVKADWAGCYAKLENDTVFKPGDTITYVVGSDGVSYGRSIYGIYYKIQYDPEVLEPILTPNDGVGSYYGWENISAYIEEETYSTYETIVLDIQTKDVNKYLTNDKANEKIGRNFYELAYVKFKIKDTNHDGTKIILKQNYLDDAEKGYNKYGYWTSSYKYTYDEEFYHEYEKEPCFDTINTFVSIDNTENNAYLDDLKIDIGTLSPSFNSKKYIYTVEVEENVDSISIEGICNFENCTVEGNGIKKINVGENSFYIFVKNQEGKAQAYNLIVRRKSTEEILLESLEIENFKLTPAFDSNTLNYYIANIPYEVDKLDIKYKSNIDGVDVSVTGNENLKAGNNTIKIKLSKKDKEKEYTITVTKIKESIVDNVNVNDNKFDNNIIRKVLICILIIISGIIVFYILSKIKRKRGE